MSMIIAARRTAVTPRDGAFRHLALWQLAVPIIHHLLDQAGIARHDVDQVIVSNALGAGGNPARVIALAAGLPHVSGLSLDTQCAGGLDALTLASAYIQSGMAQIVIAGGVESYSRRPLRTMTFSDGRPPESYLRPAFSPDPQSDPDMTEAANHLAMHYGITREEQDHYAVESHRKAQEAMPRLITEIEPIAGADRDTYTRQLSARLAARTPILSGSVSLAATAVEADGAAFCLLVSPKIAACLRPEMTVTVRDAIAVGGDPRLPGEAPVAAIRQLFARQPAVSPHHCMAEIMEAYAAQALVCIRESGIHPDNINLAGGALARGHPVGASGAILACRLFHELKTANTDHGLCAIAAAGGIGSALLMSRLT